MSKDLRGGPPGPRPTPKPRPGSLNELISKIKDFMHLKAGWDSYESQPIRKETGQLALHLVKFLPDGHDWFVSPTSEGGIMFESDTAMIEVIDVGKLERR